MYCCQSCESDGNTYHEYGTGTVNMRPVAGATSWHIVDAGKHRNVDIPGEGASLPMVGRAVLGRALTREIMRRSAEQRGKHTPPDALPPPPV